MGSVAVEFSGFTIYVFVVGRFGVWYLLVLGPVGLEFSGFMVNTFVVGPFGVSGFCMCWVRVGVFVGFGFLDSGLWIWRFGSVGL